MDNQKYIEHFLCFTPKQQENIDKLAEKLNCNSFEELYDKLFMLGEIFSDALIGDCDIFMADKEKVSVKKNTITIKGTKKFVFSIKDTMTEILDINKKIKETNQFGMRIDPFLA